MSAICFFPFFCPFFLVGKRAEGGFHEVDDVVSFLDPRPKRPRKSDDRGNKKGVDFKSDEMQNRE